MVKVWTVDTQDFGEILEEIRGAMILMNRSIEELMRSEPGKLEVFTETDGSFRLDGLQDRAYRLLALHPITAEVVEVGGVQAGKQNVLITMRGDSNLQSVAGRVVAYDGTPISGARVRAQCDVRTEDGYGGVHTVEAQRTTTDADGSFEMRPMRTEGVALVVSSDGVLDVSRQLADGVGLEDLLIRVAAECHFKVELTEPDSADVMSVLDENGEALTLTLTLPTGLKLRAKSFRFGGNGTDVMVTDERASTIVLKKGSKEVARIAVTFESSGVNLVQW